MKINFNNGIKTIAIGAALALSAGMRAQALDANKAYISVPLASLEFAPLAPGLEYAIVSGKPNEGASSFMLRFAPNNLGGMHSHTSNYQAMVVVGATKHWRLGENGRDVPLQMAGDYWYQAAGDVHQDSNPTNEPAIVFIAMDGPLDIHSHEN